MSVPLQACVASLMVSIVISAEPPKVPPSEHESIADSESPHSRWEEAARALAEVIARDPTDARARQDRAVALLYAERYNEALQHLEEGLQVLPRDLKLKHALARLLAACPRPAVRDGQRALSLAQEVLRKEPSYDHVETVGMALAELGRFEEAIDWQGRLLEQATRSGRVALAPRIRKRLEAYQRGEPCRAPWLEQPGRQLGANVP